MHFDCENQTWQLKPSFETAETIKGSTVRRQQNDHQSSFKSFTLQHQILRQRENPGDQTFYGRFTEGGNFNWIESLNGTRRAPKPKAFT